MKKMLLIVAIFALMAGLATAQETYVDWTSAGESMVDYSGSADHEGSIGTNVAYVYARFRLLGPKWNVTCSGSASIDTWQLEDILPGQRGWMRTPFDIENTGGVTLDLGTTAVEYSGTGPDITHVEWFFTGTAFDQNHFHIYAIIADHESTEPTFSTSGIMESATTTNYLNYVGTAEGFYDDPNAEDYMIPQNDIYDKAEEDHLNFWAVDDAGSGGTVEDKIRLWLGMEIPFAGWTNYTYHTVQVTIFGEIASVAH